MIIFSRLLFSAENNLGGSYSFANIPASAFSSSLGNTITAGISSPSSLQQNPANIWNNNKFNADHVVSALHFEGKTKSYYLKRFNIETTTLNTPFIFISLRCSLI